MEQQSPRRQLEERRLWNILNETFTIYVSHFWKFAALSAAAHLPAALLSFIPLSGAGGSALNFISFIALTFGYGAAIHAVGQHYVDNKVSVGACYSRALWRGVSIAMIGAVQGALITALLFVAEAGASPLETTPAEAPLTVLEAPPGGTPTPDTTMTDMLAEDNTPPLALAPVAFALLAGIMVFLVYLTTVAPSVIVEGYRMGGALRRGVALARNSEFRILGHLIVYGLVAFGMFVAIMLPVSIVYIFVGNMALVAAGTAIASVIISPVTYIAITLLYYDLRVRKEGYSLSRLSEEMGGAAA